MVLQIGLLIESRKAFEEFSFLLAFLLLSLKVKQNSRVKAGLFSIVEKRKN